MPTAPPGRRSTSSSAASASYLDGNWRLTTRHERGSAFDDDAWELYDVSKDPNELNDLADQFPDKSEGAAGEVERRSAEVWRVPARRPQLCPQAGAGSPTSWPTLELEHLAPDRRPLGTRRALSCSASTTRSRSTFVRQPGKGNGVLLAHGSKHGGYVLWVEDGHLVYGAEPSALD